MPASYLDPETARRWRERTEPLVRAFHVYANWLVSISWKRFVVLAILLIVFVELVQTMPPFSWKVTEQVHDAPRSAKAPKREPVVKVNKPKPAASLPEGLDISIDERGVRITPRKLGGPATAASDVPNLPTPTTPTTPTTTSTPTTPTTPATPTTPTTPSTAPTPSGGVSIGIGGDGVQIKLPPGAKSDEVKRAVEEARESIEEALRDAKEAAEEAARDARDAAREAAKEAAQIETDAASGMRYRVRTVRYGDFLTNLALLWILGSVVIKFTYKGRLQAEVKAAQATEVAESESLKRQVVEARMAAMQAQVEPHFLFNTLASIDHLIETDPARASQMQKHLIALLRASMPTMREASDGGARELGRELAVIRPYLEILKVRMEERLNVRIDVPEGLHSAEFPPMMIQTLVENAIKHGLEPKAEGGSLSVRAEIVHGKLAVTVADTGLGFGKAATAGTGVGLANIRERLQLLYGHKATLAITENPAGGTVVTVTVPYVARTDETRSDEARGSFRPEGASA